MTLALARPIHTAELYEHDVALPPVLRAWFDRGARIPLVEEFVNPFIHIPDVTTRLIVRRDASGRRDVMVVGPYTRASYNAAEAAAACLRLDLTAGAVRPLLGVAAAELTDRAVPLAELPGPLAELADPLLHASLEDSVPLVESFVAQQFSDATERSHQELLAAAGAALATTSASVPAIAARLAVSERQLRNLFTTGIGVSPKHFARIGRVRRLIAEAGTAPLAQIASNQGYYDQSHMTADFRTLMGVPPTAFFQGKLPPAIPCSSYLRN